MQSLQLQLLGYYDWTYLYAARKIRDAPFYWCRRNVIVREKIDG